MLNKADAHGTRNLHPAIFKTNDTAPYQLTNESYLHLMSKKVAPRRVKQRSSTSNSHSKPKHNKSTTAYVLNVKSSSRTNSTYKGCLYKTFHQEGKNQAESHAEWALIIFHFLFFIHLELIYIIFKYY